MLLPPLVLGPKPYRPFFFRYSQLTPTKVMTDPSNKPEHKQTLSSEDLPVFLEGYWQVLRPGVQG